MESLTSFALVAVSDAAQVKQLKCDRQRDVVSVMYQLSRCWGTMWQACFEYGSCCPANLISVSSSAPPWSLLH